MHIDSSNIYFKIFTNMEFSNNWCTDNSFKTNKQAGLS